MSIYIREKSFHTQKNHTAITFSDLFKKSPNKTFGFSLHVFNCSGNPLAIVTNKGIYQGIYFLSNRE